MQLFGNSGCKAVWVACSALVLAIGIPTVPLPSDAAYAVDYVITGADTVTNGTTNNVNNPNPIAGIGDTFTVLNGASISTTGASTESAIFFFGSGQNTILNRGTLSTLGANSPGIDNRNSPDATITNAGVIVTQDSEGIFNQDSDNATILNTGSILATPLSSNTREGIRNDTSDNVTITNNGLIEISRTGIRTINSVDTTILNTGRIFGSFDGATGISNGSSNTLVVNNGVIELSGAVIFQNVGVENLISSDSTIVNRGVIVMAGPDAYGIRDRLSTNNTLINDGAITTQGQDSHGVFVETSSSGVNLTNTGSIRVDGLGARGVLFDSAASVTNSGLIFAANTGESAIELSTGSDTLTLGAGSRIQGLMDLNNGDDMVTLDHGGQDIAWRWTFENFKDASPDVLSVIGAPYVVEDPGDSSSNSGITVTVADLSREANAGAVLSDLSWAIRGAVTGRIGEAWALADAGMATGAALEDETGAPMGWNGWAKAFGGYQDRGAAGLSVATRHAYGGVVVGADIAASDSLFGAFGGFALSRLQFADPSLNDTGAKDIDTNTLFGGVYGRIENAHGLFADGTLTLGYADGDADERLRANNLVMGGIETVSGGDASGFYAASSLTLGAHVPVGDTSALLIPSLTLGQATQWRQGYNEDSSVTASQSVDDYLATVLSARLQLAARIHRITASGMAWSATFRGGVDASRDVSQDVDLTMGGESFSVAAGDGATQIGGFVGTKLTLATSDTLALTFDGEVVAKGTGGGHDSDQIGGTANLGVRMAF